MQKDFEKGFEEWKEKRKKQIEEMALRLRSEDKYCLSVTCSCCTLSQANTCCQAYQAAIKLYNSGYGRDTIKQKSLKRKKI